MRETKQIHGMMTLSTLATVLLAAACGGKAKVDGTGPGGGGGGTGGTGAGATDIVGEAPVKQEPKREISKDARSDYESAVKFFTKSDKEGWSESACRQSASQFEAVAGEHKDLIEASYMVGLAYHRCGLMAEAEKAYQATLGRKSNHGPTLSNLGEIAFRNGRVDAAKTAWVKALDAEPKLVAARINLAALQLEELRKAKDAAAFARLDKEIQTQLSNALAVDGDNIRAYTLYALTFMEGRAKNKNRLDLAKLLLDEADKKPAAAKYAPLVNARGLLFLHRNALSEALKYFQSAVEMDSKFVEARMNVGLTTLGFRKYDTAKEQFTAVLGQQPKNYDAIIGLGIAMRGMGDLDGAEGQYKKARELDGRRGEALFNLGVLYKDFKAAKSDDLKASQTAYRTARDYFKDFMSKPGVSESDRDEAKNNIADCDKVIAQLDQFMKAQAAQPPAPK